jgi:hypothetical protein
VSYKFQQEAEQDPCPQGRTQGTQKRKPGLDPRTPKGKEQEQPHHCLKSQRSAQARTHPHLCRRPPLPPEAWSSTADTRPRTTERSLLPWLARLEKALESWWEGPLTSSHHEGPGRVSRRKAPPLMLPPPHPHYIPQSQVLPWPQLLP